MPQPTLSGSISASRDIIAHTLNSGMITQQTHITFNVMVEDLDHLAQRLAQADGTLRLTNGRLEAVAEAHPPLQLPANLRDAWRLLPRASDVDAPVQRRAYAAWLLTAQPLAPPQAVAARAHCVPLAGWMSWHGLPLQFTARHWVGEGPQRQLERVPLTDVTQALQRYPACVLLGPPGCGKSRVLRRLELEAARALLTGQDIRVPVRVNLASYAASPSPLDFLTQYWQSAGVPGDCVSMVRAGEVLLLADGLNEMERLPTPGALQRRANAWQEFVDTYFSDAQNHSRVLLASRDQADYAYPLGLPRVEIAPLHDVHITAFLQAGGYDSERYWTATGWQWRHGAVESSGPVEDLLERWQYLRQRPAEIDTRLREGRMTPDTTECTRHHVQTQCRRNMGGGHSSVLRRVPACGDLTHACNGRRKPRQTASARPADLRHWPT